MNPIYETKVNITAMEVDCFGRCKMSVLLYLAQEAATGHCDLLKLDWDTMAGKGLFWAVIRSRVRVTRLPLLGETVTIRTWPLPTTRSAFPRAVELLDEKGNTLVQIISLWVLMDMDSRAMVLPGKSGVDVPGLLTGNELAAPGSILPRQGENTTSRTVRYTELDRNGHMNNTRYLDWVADLLECSFHKTHPVREFTVCYLAEAREQDRLNLSYQLSEEGVLQVEGYRQETDVPGKSTRIFAVQMQF